METEHRYLDEAGIPEYCTNTYNLSPSQKNMISNPLDMIVFHNLSYMVDCGNFAILQEEEERVLASQQLESSQSIEPAISIKQEEEDNWFETSIQEMFPDLANIYIPDALQGVETILPEPQEELHNVKPAPEPQSETIRTESQIIEKNTVVEGENESMKLEIKEETIKTEINNLTNQPTTSWKTNNSSKMSTNKKNNPQVKKRKPKVDNINIKTKQEDQKENLDIDSIPNQAQRKGIEAVDLSSLLEKFEEMEKSGPFIENVPTVSSKSIVNTQNKPAKSLGRSSTRHKIIQDSSQKKPAETTKIPKSKKAIPTMLAVPNRGEFENRSNNSHQVQDNKHTLPSNYINSGSSIDLEHDYCTVYSGSTNSPIRNKDTSKPHPNKNSMQSEKCNSLKEKSGIISTKIINMNKMPTVSTLSNKETPKVNDNLIKINSVLARNILKSRQKGPVIEIQTGQKVQHMISVLKKPPHSSANNTKQSSLSINIKESTMTTTNSSNEEIKNIIQQDTENIPLQNIKQPVRKINIEEYRKKRKQTNNSDETNFSMQRKVVYIYHASTMTEPFEEKDKKVWSIRELDTIVKPISETGKLKPKCCDVSVQTYETIFEFPGSSLVQNKKDDVAEGTNKSSSSRSRSKSRSRSRNRNNSNSSSRSSSRSKTRTSRSKNKSMYKKRRVESDRNRSKSRNRNSSTSKSRSRSKSRSNSRSRSRSSSRTRYSTHNKLRRRSRDSSSSISSCTSNARSRRRSRSSSRHSKSSSRYYSRRSRSPSILNHRRSRWSSEREKQYDRNRAYRKESCRDRDLRSRSPPQYYRRPYNDRNSREWKRQVEERRVVYVGGIENETTKADLRRRFEKFGRIIEISLHFRTKAVSFGFVTFEYKDDAYKAVEHGNDGEPLKYHLSFGGRRAFCQVNYADLDGAVNSSYGNNSNSPTDRSSFDDLLQEALNRRQKLV